MSKESQFSEYRKLVQVLSPFLFLFRHMSHLTQKQVLRSLAGLVLEKYWLRILSEEYSLWKKSIIPQSLPCTKRRLGWAGASQAFFWNDSDKDLSKDPFLYDAAHCVFLYLYVCEPCHIITSRLYISLLSIYLRLYMSRITQKHVSLRIPPQVIRAFCP